MKKKQLLAFVLFFLIIKQSFGQCVLSENFANTCGADALNTDPSCASTYFKESCIPLWKRSHGTPSIKTISGSDKYIYMWAKAGAWAGFNFTLGVYGEGIVANLPTAIQANTQYKITFRYQLSDEYTPTNSGSGFFIKATNGISAPEVIPSTIYDNACGEFLPSNSGEQVIEKIYTPNYLNNSTGWITETYAFKAQQNYSQVWVYPFTTHGVSGEVVELGLDSIRICSNPCDVNVYYQVSNFSDQTMYAPVNDGIFKTIKAGGDGGPASAAKTIALDPASRTLTTNFFATDQIDLVPTFDAAISENGVFNAQIVSCGYSARPSIDNLTNEIDAGKLRIYPNPASDIVNVDIPKTNSQQVSVEIRNINGSIVNRLDTKGDTNHLSISTINLPSGVYLIIIKANDYYETRKLVIQK